MALERLDNSVIEFTNLVDNNREIGSKKNTSIHEPATTACASNGAGDFRAISVDDMHQTMSDSARAVTAAFVTK